MHFLQEGFVTLFCKPCKKEGVKHHRDSPCIPYACSWVAHGLLMGLSWDALCELYLQGHEFAMIITCDHRDFCLSAIGQP